MPIYPELTYGMLEMGGASTQIAYFENNGDLMADLFKLQLGGARHWNIYTHSYLYFGINGAWDRLNARLYSQGTVVNPCLPVGSDIGFESWITVDKDGYFLPRSDPSSIMYNITMRNNRETFDYDACFAATYDLLRKDTNRGWCTFEMDGECAMGGVYQPPLPKNNAAVDEFIATSNFVDVYRFLDLGESAAVSTIGERAREVCEMSWSELQDYNVELGVATKSDEGDDTLAQMCFRSVFVYQLLSVGWGFGENYNMEVKDVINGQKLGWALGCMLYEINTRKWKPLL
jgi:Golgi nucleoside diphosphatase